MLTSTRSANVIGFDSLSQRLSLELTHPELAEGSSVWTTLTSTRSVNVIGFDSLSQRLSLGLTHPELAEGSSTWTTLTSTRSANVIDFDTLSQRFQTFLRKSYRVNSGQNAHTISADGKKIDSYPRQNDKLRVLVDTQHP